MPSAFSAMTTVTGPASRTDNSAVVAVKEKRKRKEKKGGVIQYWIRLQSKTGSSMLQS
jgi:hypothetical protein